MMAQDQVECTWVTINYGCFINPFQPDTIKLMWQLERTYKKCVKKRCLHYSMKYVLMKKCCSNKRTHTHTHTHTYIYIYICMYIYMHVFTNPSAWAGCDSRSISKQSLTDSNSEFSFP